MRLNLYLYTLIALKGAVYTSFSGHFLCENQILTIMS